MVQDVQVHQREEALDVSVLNPMYGRLHGISMDLCPWYLVLITSPPLSLRYGQRRAKQRGRNKNAILGQLNGSRGFLLSFPRRLQ